MSIWEPSFDLPLLSTPWHALPFPSRLILKYAPHPSRPGYVLLLTDLSSVYCEVLTGPGVLSRMTEVDAQGTRRKKGTGKAKGAERDKDKIEDEDDLIGKGEAALRSVGSMWEDVVQAKVEMKGHDYHDAVLFAQTDDFDWLFYLTELKGRLPLEILSKHLIAPLAGILLETNNIRTEDSGDAMGSVHALFQQSPTITQHMAKHHAADAASRSARSTRPPSKANNSPSTKSAESPAKAKAPPPATMAEEAEEEEEEEYISDGQTEPQPLSRGPDTPARSPAKTKARHVIESDDEGDAERLSVDEEGLSASNRNSEAESAPKSITPPPPTMSTQATRKERERLEEEEMKSRAEAMKRKMEEGGGGGGNLGRRRLRR